MIYRFQSGKHTHFAQSLKVIFTNILFKELHEKHKKLYISKIATIV